MVAACVTRQGPELRHGRTISFTLYTMLSGLPVSAARFTTGGLLMRWMRGMMIGSSLLLIGGGCGHTPERQVPDCTNCVLEIRNQRGVELELRMNDFSAGPAIGVIGAGEVRRFTVERRPDRLYGIYYRDMQRYVLTCELRSMAAEAYVYTCPER